MFRLSVCLTVLLVGAMLFSPVLWADASTTCTTESETAVKAADAPAAQEPTQEKTAEEKEAEYKTMIDGRATRILDTVGIEDKEKYERVKMTVMQHYTNLRDWQAAHEEELKGLKKEETEEAKAKIDTIEAERTKYHDEYIAALQADLTPEQVDAVKDGMTSNKVKVTYDMYLAFLPDLNDEMKKMIMDNLVEAREKAITGTSSKEKDNIFGKYKGRINNALSKAGYDLKKGEKDYFAKQKCEKAAEEAAGEKKDEKKEEVKEEKTEQKQ